MMRKEKKWAIVTGVLLLISLVSGGAAAILVGGVLYDIIYAIHKISSVLTAIFFIVSIRLSSKN